MPEPVIIETPRTFLREFVATDVDALAAVISDPDTMRYYPVPFDREAVEQWILRNRRRYAINGHGLWAMVLKSSGELVGDCGLVRQTIEGIEEVEIGYHVRRDLWSQGLATEAAAACRDYGLAHLSVDRLVSLIRPENLPSRRVAEKIGLRVWKEVTWHDLPHLLHVIRRHEMQDRRRGT